MNLESKNQTEYLIKYLFTSVDHSARYTHKTLERFFIWVSIHSCRDKDGFLAYFSGSIGSSNPGWSDSSVCEVEKEESG